MQNLTHKCWLRITHFETKLIKILNLTFLLSRAALMFFNFRLCLWGIFNSPLRILPSKSRCFFNSKYVHCKILPMTGFELQTSGRRSKTLCQMSPNSSLFVCEFLIIFPICLNCYFLASSPSLNDAISYLVTGCCCVDHSTD